MVQYERLQDPDVPTIHIQESNTVIERGEKKVLVSGPSPLSQ
jgi:hypothetical protein